MAGMLPCPMIKLTRNYIRNILLYNLITKHRLPCITRATGALVRLLRPSLLQLFLQLRQRAVLQLRGRVQIVLPIRLLDLQLHLCDLLLDFVRPQHGLALGLPLGRQLRLLVVQLQQGRFQVLQALDVGVEGVVLGV